VATVNKLKELDLFRPELHERWLALGLLMVVLIVSVLIFFAPLLNKGLELIDDKNNLVIKLQQYERILAKKDTVTANMADITSQHETQGYFNSQETDALASAEMQEAGGKLSSTQALPINNKENFNRITVRVRMTGSSHVLRTVLYKIETSKPLIIIDQIDIRPMRGIRNRTTRQIDPSNELNVNFQAVSFMRKPT